MVTMLKPDDFPVMDGAAPEGEEFYLHQAGVGRCAILLGQIRFRYEVPNAALLVDKMPWTKEARLFHVDSAGRHHALDVVVEPGGFEDENAFRCTVRPFLPES